MTPPNYNDDPCMIVTVAAVKSSATMLKGRLGGVEVELMLDSGSSVSLVQSDILLAAHSRSTADTVDDSVRRSVADSTTCQGFSAAW